MQARVDLFPLVFVGLVFFLSLLIGRFRVDVQDFGARDRVEQTQN